MSSSCIRFVAIISVATSSYLFAADVSLKEITVSANKMEENIKDVPQSISVIDANTIEEKRIKDTDAIMREIPNLTAEHFIYKTRVNFRGINHSDFTNSNPVTVYIDGIARSNNVGNYNSILSNVERIEVLRGPQGAIYGKDSIGGVINVISKSPKNSWSGFVGSEYGSYNYMMGSFNADGAIIDDKLFLTIGGYGSKDDGWIKNQFNGDKKANKKDDHKFDVTLTLKPTDKLTTRLTLVKDGSKENFYKGGTGEFGTVKRNDAKNANFEIPTFTHLKSFSQALGADYELSGAKFSSVTTHNRSRASGIYDTDFTYGPGLVNNGLSQFQDVIIDTLAQEFRLSSIDSDRFKWISGTYFEREKTENKRMGQQFDQGGAKIEMDAPSVSKADIASIFGQGSYLITDKFIITLGGRYQRVKKFIDMKAFMTPVGMAKGAPMNQLNDSTTWNKFLPKAGLTYKIDDDLSAFFSYSQGYLSGGYNYFAFIKEPAFNAQTSDNYEIGLHGNAFGNRVRFSASAFHMDIKDIHMHKILPGGIFVTSNGGKAKSDGIELEALYRVNSMIDINGALGVITTKYKENIQYPKAVGKRIENTPSYTLNLGVSYTAPSGIYARLDLRGVGDKYFDAENKTKQKPWLSADVRAGYMFKDFDIYGYVTNVTNEEYIVTLMHHSGIAGMNHFNDPRIFGAGIRYMF